MGYVPRGTVSDRQARITAVCCVVPVLLAYAGFFIYVWFGGTK